MSDGWNFLGVKPVSGSVNELPIPQPVRSEVLTVGEECHWALERGRGVLLVSNRELQDSRGKYKTYKSQGDRQLRGENDGFRLRIPPQLFPSYSADALDGVDVSDFPDDADPRVYLGQERHFFARDEMLTGDTRSVYLLTRREHEQLLGDESAEIHDSVNRVPRFV